MTKPTINGPPAKPGASNPQAGPSRSPADVQAGVRAQRQHIKDLTGEDPLRGGVAD